jgi:transposase InsO family protein
MEQMARNAVDEGAGAILHLRFAFHDRDSKFCESFRAILRSGGLTPVALPARSPNLNAFAERWVCSVKSECLSRLVLFGEGSLRRALGEYLKHYHQERNHQGKGNRLLFPESARSLERFAVRRRERLGGLLNYYNRAA